MDIRTFRATTMQEALAMVRRELGPHAAVLHTREVQPTRLFGLIRGATQIEVTASAGVNVPSRLPRRAAPPAEPRVAAERSVTERLSADRSVAEAPRQRAEAPHERIEPARPAPTFTQPMAAFPEEVKGQLTDLQSMLQELCRRSRPGPRELPDALFRLFTQLIDADMSEDLARELVERVRTEASGAELNDPLMTKARIARLIESEVSVAGPITIQPGRRRIVALVGPTGVGKTTTIAKLAANYRLKEKRRVGLITVDTYRIAAVEQLRTYADIIDLPMQVVSTPREMREALRQLEGLDLVLMDTAGRSPRDEIKIQELKAFLTEVYADEVHLVLSSVASARTLEQTAERFKSVGTTALVLTKLDEATGLGNLVPLLRSSGLPLSYLTNGQNVPDDIETATPRRVARLALAMDSVSDR